MLVPQSDMRHMNTPKLEERLSEVGISEKHVNAASVRAAPPPEQRTNEVSRAALGSLRTGERKTHDG